MTEKFISGKEQSQKGYKSFSPSFLSQEYKWSDPGINKLLEEAMMHLGELNAWSIQTPDIDFFIHMHVLKEATTSSKIEGTQTNIEDAVLSKDEINDEKRDDWQEVQNYTNATNFAIEQLGILPLSMRLLKKAHGKLLTGVRGKHKQPGEIRKSQNWIGGSSLKDAFFIPPHHDELADLLGNLEKFIHNDELSTPHLIKIAIAHYQFETIHPFLDGNGRLGRLLIVLYLMDKNILAKPTLYLSDFFEKNRSSYYDSLSMVRTSNNLDQWLKFFLNGVSSTAKKSKNTLSKITLLKQDAELKISKLGRKAKLGEALLKILFSKPIVSSKYLVKELDSTNPTVNSLIKEFLNLGILVESTGFKRNRVYSFESYLSLFR